MALPFTTPARRTIKRMLPLGTLVSVLGAGGLPCHWVPGALAAEANQPVQEIPVTLSEWALTPAHFTVAAGQTVRFMAHNAGVLPHALAVQGDGLYSESATLGSKQTLPLQVTFGASGDYDIFCPVAEGQHRLLGQDGTVSAYAADDEAPADE